MTTHAPHLVVNEDHFAIWVHQMRTTTLPQARSHLAAPMGDGTVGYCCLGLGSLLVPNCAVVPVNFDVEVPEHSHYFGTNGAEDLAPIEFIEWLLPEFADGGHTEFDLRPDWPEMGSTQGAAIYDPATGALDQVVGRMPFREVSAAKMNDDGFTFAQIADVFAYFGIGDVVGAR